MRLLYTEESANGDFKIREFSDDKIPEYAILSHTWGEDEVSFQQICACGADMKSLAGYEKIRQACSKARGDKWEYIWIDTCCIDKTSSAELSEAINSMYYWYQKAVVCYVFLADVPSQTEFAGSRWFARGWTLQELIAPSKLLFLDEKWEELGYKADLQQTVSDCTGIPTEILSGADNIRSFSVAQRMSWAGSRETTRVEDSAYSLMGIFGVNIPLIYGERHNAFIRLQEEIMRTTDDLSLFAWRSAGNTGGLLADSPAAFIHSKNIGPSNPLDVSISPPTTTSRGIYLEARFMGKGPRIGAVILECKKKGDNKFIAIYVEDVGWRMQLFGRVETKSFVFIDLKKFMLCQYPVRRICVQAGHSASARNADGSNNIPPNTIYTYKKLLTSLALNDPAPLTGAAKNGADRTLWLLLTRSDIVVDTKDPLYGRTPLGWAAKNGKLSTVQLLLD